MFDCKNWSSLFYPIILYRTRSPGVNSWQPRSTKLISMRDGPINIKLEAEVHRIPRTLHHGSFVRTPFPTKILTAHEKVQNAMEEFLQGFYLLHTWSMSGTCFSSYTRRIWEKSENFPVSIAISNGDIYRRKAKCAMICHFSKLYMAIIIVSEHFDPYTSSTLRKSKNEPISNAISDKDIDDIKTLRIIWHATYHALS